MKKKIVCLMLFGVLLFTAVGCGNEMNKIDIVDMTMENSVPELTMEEETVEETEATEDTEETETEETQAPTETETEAPSIATEYYDCEYYSCNKPLGWTVYNCPIINDAGKLNLIAIIEDPENPNNQFFFIQSMGPLFLSSNDRAVFAPYLPAGNWYPVLDSIDSKGVLEKWPSLITCITIEGNEMTAEHLGNYIFIEEIASDIFDTTNDVSVMSDTVSKVTGIDEKTYMFAYASTLRRERNPYNGITLYSANPSLGYVCEESLWEEYRETLKDCMSSFKLKTSSSSIKEEEDQIAVSESEEEVEISEEVDLNEEIEKMLPLFDMNAGE